MAVSTMTPPAKTKATTEDILRELRQDVAEQAGKAEADYKSAVRAAAAGSPPQAKTLAELLAATGRDAATFERDLARLADRVRWAAAVAGEAAADAKAADLGRQLARLREEADTSAAKYEAKLGDLHRLWKASLGEAETALDARRLLVTRPAWGSDLDRLRDLSRRAEEIGSELKQIASDTERARRDSTQEDTAGGNYERQRAKAAEFLIRLDEQRQRLEAERDQVAAEMAKEEAKLLIA